MIKLGFIDYYIDEWHANNYPKMIHEASSGEIEVTHAYAMIDSPKGGRTTDKWCADMGIKRAACIEEVINSCDGLIVLSPDNCEMHEELCALPLSSGKPTYIDKTFAPDQKTAERIFDIAKAYGTPCYSSSALRFSDEYFGIFCADSVSSWGPNDLETYSIHQIEPIAMIMGCDAKRLMYMGGKDHYRVIMDYGNGRTASFEGFEKGSPFMMNIAGEFGTKQIKVESDYFGNFIKSLVSFFKDPRPIVPHEETIAIMGIRAAAIKAKQTPLSWVDI